MADESNAKSYDDDDDFIVTTLDNPWNPFTQWDEWLAFDQACGYDTNGTVARFVYSGNNLTEGQNTDLYEEGVQRLMDVDPFCRWIKVTKKNAQSFADKARARLLAGSSQDQTAENSIEIPK